MKMSLTIALVALTSWTPIACEDKTPAAPAAPPKAVPADAPAGHATGIVVDLGTVSLGTTQVHTTRDQGAVTAGGEVPIDATITGATAKISAVRFWIGTKDGKDSMRAKADIEDPKDPNRWHTHVEVPNPIPAGAQVWVEIHLESNEKLTAAFDLKQ